jgi:hypothetical protein
MNRREFLTRVGTLTLAGTTFAVMVACGDDGDDGVGPGTGGPTDAINVNIAANHGHALSLNQSDLTAAMTVALTLTGGTHSHSLDLTAAEVDQLLASNAVTKVSGSTAAHTHSVTLTPTT